MAPGPLEELLKQQLRMWCWLSSYCHLAAPQALQELLPASGGLGHIGEMFWDMQLVRGGKGGRHSHYGVRVHKPHRRCMRALTGGPHSAAAMWSMHLLSLIFHDAFNLHTAIGMMLSTYTLQPTLMVLAAAACCRAR
jgi:hypothetical protein